MENPERVGWVAAVVAVFSVVIYFSQPDIDNPGAVHDAKLDARVNSLLARGVPHVLLELHSWHWNRESGYILIRGEVKNISTDKLENVEVVGELRTKSGTLVKTADAVVTYNPIMPGQSSPFEAITSDNPQITLCGISFRLLTGKPVPYTTVAAIQRALSGLGYKIGKADGVMGVKTRAAIREFQRKNGLVVDVKVSSDLVAKLGS